MHRKQWILIAMVVAGGAAVLGSYAYNITTHSAQLGAFWGGVPEALKPLYTFCMFAAALGFFPFTFYLLLRFDPADHTFARGYGYNAILALYGLILLPSALWMSMTFAMIARPSLGLWWLIRLDLALVGLGSLGLLVALLTHQQRSPSALHKLAVVGCLAFCFQTAVLDAIVWPAYFPTP